MQRASAACFSGVLVFPSLFVPFHPTIVRNSPSPPMFESVNGSRSLSSVS